jgi:transmembrane sensor
MTGFHDRSREEAAQWFARSRRGVMTLEERSDYETWSQDARNSAAIAEMKHIWELMGRVGTSLNSGVAEPETRTAKFARSAVLAVLCVITLGVGMLSYTGHSDFWTRLDWVER